MPLKPRKIIVENSVSGEPLTVKVLAGFRQVPVEFVDEVKAKKKDFGPNELLVVKQKGRFVRKCPGTPDYQCCDYYVLNPGIGCFYNCAYCYLHYYMNTPFTIFANTGDLISEVEGICAGRPGARLRLGSGEFIDSVGIDTVANLNEILIPALGRINNLVFEVKTKSADVKHLLDLDHQGRVVIAWSVNSDEMIVKEELRTPSLVERLEAAVLCERAGYRIGFHFDPLIHYPGWEEGYLRAVDLIFKYIDSRNMAWISLGALRFKPALKPIIKDKFPASRLIYGELIPGLDNKLRYFLPIRRRMFSTVINRIRARDSDVPVYLCMENKSLALAVGAIPGFSGR